MEGGKESDFIDLSTVQVCSVASRKECVCVCVCGLKSFGSHSNCYG